MSTLDKAEIRELLIGERHARDLGQWKRLRASYHPNACKTRVKIMWYDGDIDGFVAASERLHSPNVSLIHQIMPGRIQLCGSKALTDSWCIIQTRHAAQGENPEFDLITWLRIFSRCQKIEESGEWKMLTLEPIYMRDLITPIPPSSMPDFGDSLASFRKSYRFTAWSVSKRGLEIRDDMPGDDRPESVNEICERNEAWLNAA